MKHLFFLSLILVGLYVPASLSVGVVPENEAEVESIKAEAENVRLELVKQQQELERHIKAEEAKPEDRQAEANLKQMSDFYGKASNNIKSLDQFINKARDPSKVTGDELARAQAEVKNAQKESQELAITLKTEFINSTQDQQQQEMSNAQHELEKQSLWSTFKQAVIIGFKEAQATIAELFGAKGTAIAVREDLNSIYDNLKDYSSKAENADNLSSLYRDLGRIGDACKAQEFKLDAAMSSWQDADYAKRSSGVLKREILGILEDTITDIFEYRDAFEKNQLLLSNEDMQKLIYVEKKMNDVLGELGYIINNESAYEVLGLKPDVTADQIKKAYKQLVLKWHPDKNPENKAFATTKFKEVQAAYDILNAPAKRAVYDNQSIVKEGFEIRPMTDNEKKAFQENKQNQVSNQQSNILGSDGF